MLGPGRLKLCSSLGPTVVAGAGALLVAGALAVAGWPASWASVGAGKSPRPPANQIVFQRKIALIIPFCVIRRLSIPSRRGRDMPAVFALFKPMPDEPQRNPAGSIAYRASTSTSSLSSSAAISIRVSPVMAMPSRGPAAIPFTRTFPLGTR